MLHAYGYRDFGLPASLVGKLAGGFVPARVGAFYGHVLFPPARSGGRVLDVGCGNGQLLAALREVGWETAGIEPDPVSAGLAKKAAAVFPSLEAAGFQDDSFDYILINHVLEHLPAPVSVLERCRRLLKPAGRIGVCVPNWRALSHAVFKGCWSNLDTPRHFTLFAPAVLRALMEKLGFSVEESYTTSFRYAPGTFSQSWRFRRGSPPPALLTGGWRAAMGVLDVLLPGRGEEIVLWAARVSAPRGAAGK